MKVNVRGGNLMKAGFVLLGIFIAVSVAWSADSSAKGMKQPSTQPAAKTDPGGWKKVIEAAKKEGQIVITGMPGEEWRKSLVDMFQQEYPEITVEFSATPGRNVLPRIRQERELGKKLWDLLLGGANTALEAKRDGYLAPLRPLLLPEIADDSKWIGGIEGVFSDKEEKYSLGYILSIDRVAYVNRDFIKESDLKSCSQLVDPRFRGKIVIQTPTAGATLQALGHLAFMYGEHFVRELLSKQDVTVTDDNRQQVEWLVRGRYPIAIGIAPALLIPFEKQGLGKNVVALESPSEKASTGVGTVSLLEGAPHPNAARVYINWLLSQKTQLMISRNVQLNSSRTDVPVFDERTAVNPTKKFRNSGKEENSSFDASLLPMIKEALKK